MHGQGREVRAHPSSYKGGKVSHCMYKASLVSRTIFTKMLLHLRKEGAVLRGAGEQNLSKVIIQHLFTERPLCSHMMNETTDHAFPEYPVQLGKRKYTIIMQ